MAAISGVQPETPFWDKLQKDKHKMLHEFYKRPDKIMRPETAREVVHAGKSILTETPLDTAQAGKSTSAEKNKENKKRKSGDR